MTTSYQMYSDSQDVFARDRKIFVHAGKLGDAVLSIPAFRASGASGYLLVDPRLPGHHVYHPELLLRLFRSQGIACEILHGGGIRAADPAWINGNCFQGRLERIVLPEFGRELNLAERQCAALGLPIEGCWVKFLSIKARREAAVIFVRSPRYRPRWTEVDWKRLVLWAGDDGMFCGLQAEHAAFESEFGVRVRLRVTADYLEASELIAGADLCVANQTGLQAVMMGLQSPHILERTHHIDMCVTGQPFQWLSSDSFFNDWNFQIDRDLWKFAVLPALTPLKRTSGR